MNYSRDQLVYAAKQARDSGDMRMARGIARKLMAMDKQAEADQQEPEGYQLTEEDREIFGDMTSGAGEEFLIGMGKATNDIVTGVKDAWHRMTGDEDALSRLNKKTEEEKRLYEEGLGDSGWATAGEIAGHIGAGVATGTGVAGLAGKAAMTGRSGMAIAAAEGAAYEGLTNTGTLEERAGKAALGAGAGAGGSMIGNAIGSRLAARSGRKAAESAILDPAAERVARAKRDGGFDLDMVDATEGVHGGFMAREGARLTDEGIAFRKLQEDQILNKAKSLTPVDFDSVSEAAEYANRSAEDLFGRLQNQRWASGAKVDISFDDWRMSMGDEKIPLTGLDGRLTGYLEGMTVKADKEIGAEVREIFGKYGMLAKQGDDALVDATGRPLATGGFTAGAIEKVRQELNALYTPGLSRTAKKDLGKLKGIVDDHASLQMNRLTDGSQDTLNKGRKATEMYNAHEEKWGNGKFLEKLTRSGIDGEGFAKDPASEFKRMMRSGDKQELMKLKEAVAGNPDLEASFERLAELPLLEALEKSILPRTGELSVATFRKAIKGIDPDVRKVLWGDKRADEVFRAVEAFGLHAKEPSQKGAINKSNTGLVHNMMSAAVRLLASTGRVGQAILSIPALLSAGKKFGEKVGNEAAAAALRDGELPPAVEKKMRAAIKEQLIAQYGEQGASQMQGLIPIFMRAGMYAGIGGDE